MSGKRIRIGISACLLGESVRYDGGHKHNEYITTTLGQYFDFVPFCPEVAIGLGVPRPPIRLVQERIGVRARGVDDPKLDVTQQLVAYATQVVPALDQLSGYILKKNSPSCGMKRVKVYRGKKSAAVNGTGIYARTLMEQLPELPFEEEGRLMDPLWRGNFVERVFVYHRWQRQVGYVPGAKALIDFHTRHKLIVLAHDERAYRALGRFVATAGGAKIETTANSYVRLLMECLKRPATRARHANVLQHISGFFKKVLTRDDKHELQALIETYRRGRVPLVAPITLIRHYLRQFPDPYLAGQYYLHPHPDELALRSTI